MDRAGGKSPLPEGKSPGLHLCWLEVSDSETTLQVSTPQVPKSNHVEETPILFLSNEETHSIHLASAPLDNFKLEDITLDKVEQVKTMFVELAADKTSVETFQAIIQDDIG